MSSIVERFLLRRSYGPSAPPATRVLDLEPRLRYRECDARCRAVVPVRWAAG